MDEGAHTCTDEEIDAALATFRSEVRVPAESVRQAREQLTAAIGPGAGDTWAPAPLHAVRPVAVDEPPARRRSLHPVASGLVAAAAVAALVVGVLTVSSRLGGGDTGAADAGPGAVPVASGAAPARVDEVLNRSADLVAGEKPDGRRFRYVEEHSWQRTSVPRDGGQTPLVYEGETVIRSWIPADADAEWQRDVVFTGERRWIDGDDHALTAARAEDPSRTGVPDDPRPPTETLRGRGGAFGGPAGTPAQLWATPTAAFVAGLPRDPQQLFDRLRRDAPRKRGDDGPAPTTLLLYATDLLHTGAPPPDLRAALYRALTRVPGVAVTAASTDLEGRHGVAALGVVDPDGGRLEMVVDPRSGAFLGTRTTDADGTVQNLRTVTTTGADEIGVVPTG